MIRAAVIGVGYLGRFHAQKYAHMKNVNLVGVVDINKEQAQAVGQEMGCAAFTDFREILDGVDVVSVVVPTVDHYTVASEVLGRGVHCLLEKPISTTVEEADRLIELAKDKRVVLQIGHLERFNPAVQVLEEKVEHPLFIEAHRLSGYKNRATDVDVVLDLMIHDLDIILSLVQAPLEEILAVGVPVLTPHVDIANVRLIFSNGCTANLTASRISLQAMRRIRVFQPGSYISVDCLERKSLVVTQDLNVGPESAIRPELTSLEGGDILFDELAAFTRAVHGLEPPKVTGEAGRAALAVALQIGRQIRNGLQTADLTENAWVEAHAS